MKVGKSERGGAGRGRGVEKGLGVLTAEGTCPLRRDNMST